VEANPYRENLRAHLMLALYRSGRQVDALEVFRRARTVLVNELGVEPGAGLQRLHEAMLRADERLAHGTVEDLQRPEPTSIASAVPEPVVVVPRELPGDVAGFTGRIEQLRTLTAMVPDERAGPAPMVVSTIAGMAGVGKPNPGI
jgi:hypothetical protein